MFSDISVKRWADFFDTITRIMQCEEGSGSEFMAEPGDEPI